MKRFEDALDVRALDDGRNWLVLEDFYYDTDVVLPSSNSVLPVKQRDVHGAQGFQRIIVPKGFTTDFASIPRVLWTTVGAPADGKYRKAAVVHDYLYRTPGLATRGQADAVLMEAMEVCGVGWWTRHQIYWGVRVGGHWSYKGGL